MALDPPPSKAEKLSKAVQMLKSHHKSMHSRTSGGGQTGQLLTAAAALTALSFATAAPPTPLLFSAAKISLVAASVGFFSLHAAVSYGYGLSLAGHAGTLLGMCAGSPARSILSLTVLLYGVKVCLLQLVRDSRPSYTKRVLSAFTGLVPSTKCPFTTSMAKLPLIAAFSLLYAAYAMPLWAVSHAPSSISSGLRGGLTLAGCIAAITGLTLQTVADVQKFVAKEQLGADAPILDKGLWAFSRHPNYA
ncbi:MAG: hypothetical protein SGPRY_008739, partial [Prymnesium sp.]